MTVERLAQAYAAALRRRAENGAPSQRDMGAALGLSKPHISEMIARYEAGDPPKSIRLMFKLCLATGIAPVFAPQEVVRKAGLEPLPAKPDAAARVLMGRVEHAGISQGRLASLCDTHQSLVSGAISRYRALSPPKSTELYFGVAAEAGLVSALIPASDFREVAGTLDRLMTVDENKEALRVMRNERASIASCLAELTEAQREDPEFHRHFANTKLSLEDVAYIRGSFESLDEAAARFGISKSTASYIRNELTWSTKPLGP
ncbi:transcriptional regulator with XRE-family HTH domain [Bradyrhizobium sp. USDA 4341]